MPSILQLYSSQVRRIVGFRCGGVWNNDSLAQGPLPLLIASRSISGSSKAFRSPPRSTPAGPFQRQARVPIASEDPPSKRAAQPASPFLNALTHSTPSSAPKSEAEPKHSPPRARAKLRRNKQSRVVKRKFSISLPRVQLASWRPAPWCQGSRLLRPSTDRGKIEAGWPCDPSQRGYPALGLEGVRCFPKIHPWRGCLGR